MTNERSDKTPGAIIPIGTDRYTILWHCYRAIIKSLNYQIVRGDRTLAVEGWYKAEFLEIAIFTTSGYNTPNF